MQDYQANGETSQAKTEEHRREVLVKIRNQIISLPNRGALTAVILQAENQLSKIKAKWDNGYGQKAEVLNEISVLGNILILHVDALNGFEKTLRLVRDFRGYQDQKVEENQFSSAHGVSGEILLMEKYVGRAREAWCSKTGDGPAEVELLKVLAIVVRCLEHHWEVPKE